VIVAQWGFSYGSGKGGREIFIDRISGSLSKLGHEIHQLQESETELQKVRSSDTVIKKHYIPNDLPAITSQIKKVVSLLEDMKLDLIHYHTTHDRSLIYLQSFLKKRKIPLVLTIHDVASLEKKNPLAPVTNFVLPSNYMAERFSAKYINETFTVIPNGVPIKNRVEEKTNKRRIIFAGNINYNKGILQLVFAWEKIYKKYPETELHLFGEGAHSDFIENYVRKSDIAIRTFFHGWQEDVTSKLKTSDIVIVPSLIPEAFGLIAAEALGMEIPVIASDMGALREIVSDNCGILVPKLDANAIAVSIMKLLDNLELSLRMGRNGREIVEEKYSLVEMAKSYENLYFNLKQKIKI
jgi:glycosyltransferase involved in cell wall biosynthesis